MIGLIPSLFLTGAELVEAASTPLVPMAQESADAQAAAPVLGRIETPHGAREYLLFAPPRPAARPMLIVMLHGCRQDAAQFARDTAMADLAAARGIHVVFPEQTQRANRMRCWNWYDPGHQSAEGGEPALIAALIDELAAQNGAPWADVFVAGLSAGGAMAAVLGQTMPDRIRAVGIHSGVGPGAAATVFQGIAAMRDGVAELPVPAVPMIVFHGDADRVVAVQNGRALGAHLGANPDGRSHDGPGFTRSIGADGEYWQIDGLGHAWSGGRGTGRWVAPGPDASAEMLRFFWMRRST